MSVLDYVRDRLDPDVFNVDSNPPHIWPEARDEIKRILVDGLKRDGDFVSPEGWITGITLIGSSLT